MGRPSELFAQPGTSDGTTGFRWGRRHDFPASPARAAGPPVPAPIPWGMRRVELEAGPSPGRHAPEVRLSDSGARFPPLETPQADHRNASMAYKATVLNIDQAFQRVILEFRLSRWFTRREPDWRHVRCCSLSITTSLDWRKRCKRLPSRGFHRMASSRPSRNQFLDDREPRFSDRPTTRLWRSARSTPRVSVSGTSAHRIPEHCTAMRASSGHCRCSMSTSAVMHDGQVVGSAPLVGIPAFRRCVGSYSKSAEVAWPTHLEKKSRRDQRASDVMSARNGWPDLADRIMSQRQIGAHLRIGVDYSWDMQYLSR